LTFQGATGIFEGRVFARTSKENLKEVDMFGSLGPTELILILLIVIIIFGARKLPDLGRSIGEGIKNFKKSINTSEESDKDKAAKKPEPPTN
jgi:sec-independent protein translocase protein TatA